MRFLLAMLSSLTYRAASSGRVPADGYLVTRYDPSTGERTSYRMGAHA